ITFEDNQYKLKPFEWGVIAPYMRTPEEIKKGRNSTANARSEKIIDDHKSLWYKMRAHRCLIPVTGIFEHREVRGWKKKVPYLIQEKRRPLFCIPGLYNYPFMPNPETGEIKGTFTLITRPANPLLKQIHNSGPNAGRMPLFLNKELEQKWLLPDLTDDEIKEVLEFELPADKLKEHTVYTIRGGKPRPDGKGVLEPYTWSDLPPLGEANPDRKEAEPKNVD
ncbi:MAG TPA: SOS response-associated peptidase family protein, partial [Flavisolibacter sp.]|nr:SOS response-associated peptidase family protein [Flavisolibacter sp.]